MSIGDCLRQSWCNKLWFFVSDLQDKRSWVQFQPKDTVIEILFEWPLSSKFAQNFELILIDITLFHENENSWKSVTSSTSLHIYNVQTKGIQHKSMVETSIKGRGLRLLVNSYHYRPQTKFAKVMFLHLSVILVTGGCLPQCMLGSIPPGQKADLPRPEADPLRTRGRPPWTRGRHTPPEPEADTPLNQRQTPLPPRTKGRHPTPEKAHPPSATSGRYVSYWNAYLLQPINALKNKKPIF